MSRCRRAAALLLVVAVHAVLTACQVPPANDWERLDVDRVPAAVPWLTNVAYAQDSANQVIDFYEASKSDVATKVVLFVHGGAWVIGDEDELPPVARYLLDEGWMVGSVRYRLGGEARWPAQRDDVQLATAWARQTTGATTVVVMGHSAGGHIAAAAALAPPVVEGGRPDGVVVMSAPLDPSAFAAHSSLPKRTIDLAMHLTFGCPAADWRGCSTPELASADILKDADAGDPPFYIAAGDLDTTVPWAQGQSVVAAELESALGQTRVWVDVVDYGPEQWRQHELDGALNLRYLELWLRDRVAGP